MAAYLAQVQELYQAYIEKATALEANKKPFAGFLGIGKKPSDDPCHEQFVMDLKARLTDYVQEGMPSGDLRAVLSYIFRAPQGNETPMSVYWTLVAAHSAVPDVIPALNREDAAALAAEFESLYRRRDRLPVQEKLLKALKQAAK